MKNVYDKQMAVKAAAVHAVVAQDMAKSWNKMAKTKGGEEADAESMQRMAKACTLIQKQADALIAIAGGDDAQATEYQKQREAAAKAIAAIRKEMDDFFKK